MRWIWRYVVGVVPKEGGDVTIRLVWYAFAAYHWDCPFPLRYHFPSQSRVVLQGLYDS